MPRRFQGTIRSVFCAAGLFLALIAGTPAASAPANPLDDRLNTARRDLARAQAAHRGDHPALADAYATLGDRLLSAMKLDEAEAPIRTAHDMRRRLRGDGDPSVAVSLHQLGNLEKARRNFDRGLDYHRQALEVRRALHRDHPDVAASLILVAHVLLGASDWGQGEALLREALAMMRRIYPRNDPRIAEALTLLGDILRWQYELAEAEEVLREAVAILRSRPNEEVRLAESLEQLALLHRFKREHDRAAPLLLEVVAIRRRYLGEDAYATLIGRANVALNFAYEERHAEADREFEALRAVVRRSKGGADLRRLDEVLDAYMCGVGGVRHDWPMAERYARAVVATTRRSKHEVELSNHLRKLGEARAGQGDLDEAERCLVESAAVYEEARRKIEAGIKRASFKKTPYEQLALVRLERGDHDGAWVALEAARARVLAEQLLAGREGRNEATSPAASELSLAAPYPLSRIQDDLGRDQAIVAWLDCDLYPGELRSWACVIRKGGTPRWVRLPVNGDLAALSKRLSEFQHRIGDPAIASKDADWMSEARALWRMRFAPLERNLRGVRELILVPSWAMGSFPAGMLVDKRGRLVGDRYAIVHAPSATVFSMLRQAARFDVAEPRTALLVGDPPFHRRGASRPDSGDGSFTLSTLRSAMRGDDRALGSLPRLKHSRDEIAGVATFLPGSRILVDEDASERAVASLASSGAMSRFQVVHFATHALIDHERPAQSGLVLSRLETSGPDGIVTGAEISKSWRLDANLVTLSACQTAVGRSIFGEGVVGLSYPLLEAGARSLLVSQWKVDDEATALLMKRFYRNWLGKGAFPWSPRMNKASALREAQQWLRDYRDPHGRRPFAHPIYWAAFVLVGDPG